MNITLFTRDDTMLASELTHQVTQPVSPLLGSLIRNELGAPSFHSKVVDAWYARANLTRNGPDTTDLAVPFALRCDHNGNWTISVPLELENALADCVGAIVPNIIIEELPRGRVAGGHS